ncbi:MAG: methyl-branched lipid omega-hydroxylase, partial [Actinomycetota bacterium]|nr:methyl-branched lipid omega-hydroxylase [Actinomycetota bacterium]
AEQIVDPAFWQLPLAERMAAFAELREQGPFIEASFHNPMTNQPERFYAVTRYAEVVEISRRPQDFCSGKGAPQIPDLPQEALEYFGSFINMDDPKHARLRKIVSRVFTPKHLGAVMDQVETSAAEVVDEVIDKGSCDFVTEVAAVLPLRIIVDMMGIDRSDEKFIFDRTNVILGAGDPEYVPDQDNPGAVMTALLTAGQELAMMVQQLGEDRIKNPKDDLITALITADVDGEKLSSAELGSFFILLVVAGNETTRNAIAHGLHVLTEHPEQKQLWMDDFDGVTNTAVEELVRWATPVIHFRRTVTADGTRIGEHEFNEGDKVVLFYNSANRDEAVFTDPQTFDVRRTPNDHVGFGGPGPHFCLGAHLARREITVLFRELFRRVPDIHATGEPERLRSNFINGIKHLPAAW